MGFWHICCHIGRYLVGGLIGKLQEFRSYPEVLSCKEETIYDSLEPGNNEWRVCKSAELHRVSDHYAFSHINPHEIEIC